MWDGSGSLFALGMRLTKISATGAPIPGAQSSYKTNALITIGVGLEYREGAEVEQPNGSGAICLYYAADPTLKRGTITDLQVCTPDPNVLQFTIGGDIIEGPPAVAEVQTLTISGIPTGGTYILVVDGTSTDPLAYNANAAAIEAELDALVDGGVTVTGTGPYTITFTTEAGNVPQLGADGSGLTGGTNPDAAITTTTPGLNLTEIGYAAPEVGSAPTPNGIGLEFWTAAVSDGTIVSDYPYLQWVLPLVKLQPSDAWTAEGENPLLPGFEGFSYQNQNWNGGPDGTWPYISDRVWQFARVQTLPDLSPGFVEVPA